jgi:hypothetical protein
MFEKRKQPLSSARIFALRLICSVLIGFLLVILALAVGVWGYHYYEDMSWVDAFVNAAMILSGMGPLTPLHTTGGKLFAGMYAIFSGLAFILIIGVILAPVIHRFFHAFHLDESDLDKK